MLFSEFYAEIQNSLKQYDSAGLINELSVHNWVMDGLKKFGNLPTIRIEKVLEVNNRQAQLPSGFRSLYLAVKCEPYDYEADQEAEDLLQKSYMYTVKEMVTSSNSICEPCCDKEIKESCIVEKLYFRNGSRANIYYKNPQWLQLTPHIQRDFCDKNCVNFKMHGKKHEININHKVLYTNFDEGSIFMIYNGYEEDDDGYIIIPETSKGYLQNYLEYTVKRRIIEEILGNSDNSTNEATLYQIYKQAELENFANAKTELKFKNIGIGIKNYKRKIKREFQAYNFGGLTTNQQGRITFLVT